jgi:hypothetical protein
MVVRTVDTAGIDHVAVSTDRSHHFTKPDYDWMRMGRWTRGVELGASSSLRSGKAPPPDWLIEPKGIARPPPCPRRASAHPSNGPRPYGRPYPRFDMGAACPQAPWSASRPVGQSASRPVGQSASRPVGQSASRPVGQPASRPVPGPGGSVAKRLRSRGRARPRCAAAKALAQPHPPT